jgi:hypothetical protein
MAEFRRFRGLARLVLLFLIPDSQGDGATVT